MSSSAAEEFDQIFAGGAITKKEVSFVEENKNICKEVFKNQENI